METVTAAQLKAEVLNRRYQDLLSKPEVFPSQRNWEYIQSAKMQGGIGPLLYRKYLVALLTEPVDRIEYHKLAITEFPRYLALLDYDYACQVVYSDTTTVPEAAVDLIRKNNLFSAKYIKAMVDAGGQQLLTATMLLGTMKPEYTMADIAPMQQLLTALYDLPKEGEMARQRTMFGVTTKYVCPNGHANPAEAEFCEHPDCRLDIYGLTIEAHKAIDDYENQFAILKDMLYQ